MNLYGFEGKHIRVVFVDGQTLTGTAHEYTQALDNPQEKESLCIGDVIFFEDEVAEIREIET